MEVVGLISGGKDSCYNLLECLKYGHRLVALANLYPLEDGVDELDSACFQSVGHTVVPAMAACIGVPLYRRGTRAKAVCTSVSYEEREGDEVEDLFELLSRIKADFPTVRGVSVGAILSNYQRERVESVCSRLGLEPLSFLWQREAEGLLEEMVQSEMDVRFVKVSGMGCKVEWLGKQLDASIQEQLLSSSHSFQTHPLGEGGEFETIVVACPGLFQPNTRVDLGETTTHIVSKDPFAPVAHLSVPTPTPLSTSTSTPLSPKIILVTTEGSGSGEGGEGGGEGGGGGGGGGGGEGEGEGGGDGGGGGGGGDVDGDSMLPTHLEPSASFVRSVCGEGKDVLEALEVVEERLRPLTLSHVVFSHLYIPSMAAFGAVNTSYCSRFRPPFPARACVEVDELRDVVRVEVQASLLERKVLHVRSRSAWAPQCIGAYAQANCSGGVVFAAGQIGLDPVRMQLVEGGTAEQASQAWRNLQAVLQVLHSSTSLALSATVFLSPEADLSLAAEIASAHLSVSSPLQVVFCVVPMLPKGALVELELVALQEKPSASEPDEATTSHRPPLSAVLQCIPSPPPPILPPFPESTTRVIATPEVLRSLAIHINTAAVPVQAVYVGNPPQRCTAVGVTLEK